MFLLFDYHGCVRHFKSYKSHSGLCTNVLDKNHMWICPTVILKHFNKRYENLFLDRDDIVQNYRPMSVGSRQITLSWEKPKKGDVTQYVVSSKAVTFPIMTVTFHFNALILETEIKSLFNFAYYMDSRK